MLDAKAGAARGLAFAHDDVNRFVDPRNSKSLRDFCEEIGKQIDAKRPLGTSEIASTVVFEHSLPKALLPLLIFGGAQVKGADGNTFAWQPLLRSQHVKTRRKTTRTTTARAARCSRETSSSIRLRPLSFRRNDSLDRSSKDPCGLRTTLSASPGPL